MSAPSPTSILVVADPPGLAELATALAEPLPYGAAEVHLSSGSDDTIDLFDAHHPAVVVVTASLELGDAKSLIEVLRDKAPRAEVAIVLIGDGDGPIRTALDAIELAPDRFVSRPVVAKALRFAVNSALEAVALARGGSAVSAPRTTTDKGTGVAIYGAVAGESGGAAMPGEVDDDPTASTKAAQRARWLALADSIGDGIDGDGDAPAAQSADEPAPLPPPIMIQPRRHVTGEAGVPPSAWRPGTTSELPDGWRDVDGSTPAREPTLILPEVPQVHARGPDDLPLFEPSDLPLRPPADDSARDSDSVVVAARGEDERWSEPVELVPLGDRESKRDAQAPARNDRLDDFDDEIVVGDLPPPGALRDDATGALEHEHDAELRELDALLDPPPAEIVGGRDFARQLRDKMSKMAQRLFQHAPGSSPAVDLKPRHDHQTEIDLASIGEELALGGVTEISRGRLPEARDSTTSPGSWDTQVRERGLPDAGEVVRGVSDAPMLLARMFAQSATGRIGFRRGEVEKVVFFDQGRPVFAASNEPGDRMGELLVREGKITAAQYERCQTNVAQSGRRMGEILVDFGYLKRRELLPAVRRHVEDVLYSLFGWDRGHYHITLDSTPSAERIRLSRHPASLILEGIRRKLDRTTLDRMVGAPSTVIDVPDRERLGGIVNVGDLSSEERAALAAFDGQVDLASVARTAGVDVADVLPLAWGLCVLGLATARRAESEQADESSALVGETDLAIDRERVHARWQLVSDADYFALLGVRRDATAFEIRRAYQAARRDFAVDCFPGDLRRELARELEDIASVLDEAFRVLRDDRLRVTYLSNLVE